MYRAPTVAIIGRPNVGKSTLFNRLVGQRQSIVHDLPGVTRDRIFGKVELDGERRIELIDTGGLVPGDDPLGLGEQVQLAIDESDLLLMVVDGKAGLNAADQAVWDTARRSNKPAVLVVNKGDTKIAQDNFHDFYRLGAGPQVLVSAEHGTGFDDLHDEIDELLDFEPTEDPDPQAPALAIVGRPNVGKSSLVNRLIGTDRTLVSPKAGTTRDPIDSLIEWQGTNYRLIDTAGIRRRSQVSEQAEGIAVLFAHRQIERAQLVVLVIDASAGVTTGDLGIAGEAWDQGRPVVVAVNKWDLLKGDEDLREEFDKSWERLDQLLSSPERVNLSALSGRHIDRLLPAVERTLERAQVKLTTSEVNRMIEAALEAHQPPQIKGRPWKVYYTTQTGNTPPTFLLFANRTLERTNTYRRYLENRLREALDLWGVPIRLAVRRR